MLLDYLSASRTAVATEATTNFEKRYPELLSQLGAEGIRYAVTDTSPELVYLQLTFSRSPQDTPLVVNLAADGRVNVAGLTLSEATLARQLAQQVHEWDGQARSGQWAAQHPVLSKTPGVLLVGGLAGALVAGFSAKPSGGAGWSLLAACIGVTSILVGLAVHMYADYHANPNRYPRGAASFSRGRAGADGSRRGRGARGLRHPAAGVL